MIRSLDYKEMSEAVFIDFLKSNGHLYTFERHMIFDVIMDAAGASGHFSAEAIYKKMMSERKRVAKSTLYKTIQLLEDCEVLRKCGMTNKHNIYEGVMPFNSGHLVCITCARIIEINHKTIKEIISSICRHKRFRIRSHILEIKGYCADCLPDMPDTDHPPERSP